MCCSMYDQLKGENMEKVLGVYGNVNRNWGMDSPFAHSFTTRRWASISARSYYWTMLGPLIPLLCIIIAVQACIPIVALRR